MFYKNLSLHQPNFLGGYVKNICNRIIYDNIWKTPSVNVGICVLKLFFTRMCRYPMLIKNEKNIKK